MTQSIDAKVQARVLLRLGIRMVISQAVLLLTYHLVERKAQQQPTGINTIRRKVRR